MPGELWFARILGELGEQLENVARYAQQRRRFELADKLAVARLECARTADLEAADIDDEEAPETGRCVCGAPESCTAPRFGGQHVPPEVWLGWEARQ